MNKEQQERYSRHLILHEIGEQGQQKLLKAKVLVIGAGGLGAPILQYLVAAGIGTIGIVDADEVSLSNLQRQILYREEDVRKSKANIAKETLSRLNSDVNIIAYPFMLNQSNADEIISEYDVVVGATDNFESRILMDQITKIQRKPFVHGSIGEFEGQVSVFNYQGGPSYTNLYPDTPESSDLPLGVMGVLPGVVGSLQAVEVIKIITEIGDVLSGKLLIYDALNCSFQKLTFA